MILVAIGRALQFVLMLVIMRVATSVLIPAEMGRMSLIVATTALFALFFVNPVGMYINRRLHEWDEKGQVRQFLKYFYVYLFVIAGFVAVTLAIMNSLLIFEFHMSTAWLICLVSGSLLINTWNQTTIPSLNMLGFRNLFLGLTLGTLLSGFLIALAFVQLFKPSAEYWLISLLLGQGIFAVIGNIMFVARLKKSQSETTPQPMDLSLVREGVSKLFPFVWPVAVAVGLNWLQMQGYRFLLSESLGLSALGLFVAGYGLSSGLLTGFDSILTTYFLPMFYQKINIAGNDARAHSTIWDSYASAVIPSLVLVAGFLIVAAPELVRLLLGAQYQNSAQFVVWGALAEVFKLIASVYGMAAHARMKTKLLLLPNIVGAALSLLLVFLLVPKMGASGAGVALAVAGFVMVITLHYRISRDGPLRLPLVRLMRSLLMGALLFLIMMSAKTLLADSDNLWNTLGLLFIGGVSFLGMQYSLLKSVELAK